MPTTTKAAALPVLAVLALIPAQSHAHHSTSPYDRNAHVAIEGTLVRYEWMNPHVYLWVREKTGGGEAVTWQIEGLPPAILRRLGWTKDTLHVGDRVVVHANPSRDPGKRTALLESLDKAGHAVVSMAKVAPSLIQDDPAKAAHATGLAGTWVTLLSPQTLGGLTAAALPATAKGRAAIDSYKDTVDNPELDCVALTAPMLMVAPDIKSIDVRDDVVVIRGEFDDVDRVVHLNVDSHDGAPASLQGHSIGHWEGKTLVVDTAHFAPHRTFSIGVGLPSGPRKHLVERFALDEDGAHLTYSFELTDPEYLAKPVNGEARWSYRPDLRYVALPCNRENARRYVEQQAAIGR